MDADEKHQIRTEFAKLSHDVRSPLTSILGFAQLMLEDEAITGANREYLELIENDAKNLNAMLLDGLEQIGKMIDGQEN